MREDERQASRDVSSSVISVPTTAPEMNFSHVQFSQTDLNKLILDFLVTDGRLDVAECFRREAELTSFDQSTGSRVSDAAAGSARVEIRDHVAKGEVQSATEKLNDVHPEMLDANAKLHFHLLQQHLIELIRNGDTIGAIKFAQDVISKKATTNPMTLAELEQTLALLVFPKPGDSPFGDLMETAQRDKVAREVNSALLVEEGQRPVSQLESIMKLIMWCEEQLDNKSIDHPKLDDLFKDL